ncbi:MAG: gamma-glutamyl-gamma-aminobutyrate hydrolase family protein [Oscillospiraceae bacterium]|jgi:putative glutamine amidotransferase|nr:gamma-glutamyl-gamma-aminobutyrate hydrolase family protein [Oscillospiraceae bacterium]
MGKPQIGVVPLWDETRDSLWMLPGYLEGIARAGGLPLVLPLTSDEASLAQILGLCDGFLFPGGHDVDPGRYGEETAAHCGPVCAMRDEMEARLFAAALAADRPMLGICRGLQLFNVLLGGTLYQDLPVQRPGAVCHEQRPPYDRAALRVTLAPGGPLRELLGAGPLPVNSYHHQGVKAIAPGFVPAAHAEDGLVEAAVLPGRRFVWAVQWHPELALEEASSQALFGRLTAEAASAGGRD